MTAWARRFLPMPVSRLRITDQLQTSPKVTRQQLLDYVKRCDQLYDLIDRGMSVAQLERMSRAPLNAEEAQLGATWRTMFSSDPTNPDRVEADLRADGTFSVERGRHRVEAAKQSGIDTLPVWVRAPSEREADRLGAAVLHDAERRAPRVADFHRSLDPKLERSGVGEVGRIAQRPGPDLDDSDRHRRRPERSR